MYENIPSPVAYCYAVDEPEPEVSPELPLLSVVLWLADGTWWNAEDERPLTQAEVNLLMPYMREVPFTQEAIPPKED